MTVKGWATADKFADDWNTVSTAAPPPPAEGIYHLVFDEVSPELSAKSSKPILKIKGTIDQAFGTDEKLKRTMFDTTGFTAESAFRVKQLGVSAGVELPPNNGKEAAEEFAAALLASDGAWFKLKHEKASEVDAVTGEPKVYARVDRYLTAEEAEKAHAALVAKATGEEAATEAKPQRKRRSAS
jgi:hypothetical protein